MLSLHSALPPALFREQWQLLVAQEPWDPWQHHHHGLYSLCRAHCDDGRGSEGGSTADFVTSTSSLPWQELSTSHRAHPLLEGPHKPSKCSFKPIIKLITESLSLSSVRHQDPIPTAASEQFNFYMRTFKKPASQPNH